MNTDQAFKSQHQNPSHLTNSATMNTEHLLNSGGNLFNGCSSRILPTPEYVNNSTNTNNNNGEGYGTNTFDLFGYQSNIFLGSGGSLASLSSQRYTDHIPMLPVTYNNNGQTYDNLERSGMQSEGYGTSSSDLFGYQSNFVLGSGGNITSLSSQRYTPMMPTTGFVNSSTNNDNTKEHFYLNTEASNTSGVYDTNPARFQSVSRTSSSLQHRVLMKTEPQWTIKKELTKTDLANNSCKLFLAEHILKHIRKEHKIKVNVYDHDTNTKHKLNLAFSKCWRKHFVQRRKLKEGDEIGLFWDSTASALHFRVLSRALERSFLDRNSQHSYVEMLTRTSSSPSHQQQQWSITKKLSKTDANYSSSKLYLEKRSVKEHILKHLSEEDCENIVSSKHGIKVSVYDQDTDTTHKLCLAFQKCYVLTGGWWIHFVGRRGLKEGDEVGLLWDCYASKLRFRVLSRATKEKKQCINYKS